jgi:phosphonate degradation associated HDIG domain protein
MELLQDLSFTHRIEALFARHGGTLYEGARAEPVTALAHALQCAQLAEWAHADTSLVAAALLHDVGHFVELDIDLDRPGDRTDDRHEEAAVPLLAQAFDASVTEPVRLHVAAKRYLVRVDGRHAETLSPASVHSLALQGGPMGDDELRRFEALPFAMDAVQLRRWDDLAKVPGKRTPPLSYYLALLDELQVRPAVFAKTGIGATDLG